MHGDVHTETVAKLKGIEGHARAPGVVDGREHAVFAADAHERWQIRKLHGDRTCSLQPHQTALGAQQLTQALRLHGIVELGGDAPPRQFVLSQGFVGAIGIGGNQNFIPRLQQSKVDEGNGGQAAGREQRVPPTFQ